MFNVFNCFNIFFCFELEGNYLYYDLKIGQFFQVLLWYVFGDGVFLGFFYFRGDDSYMKLQVFLLYRGNVRYIVNLYILVNLFNRYQVFI